MIRMDNEQGSKKENTSEPVEAKVEERREQSLPTDKKELSKKKAELQKEISALRANLNDANDKKEKAYSEKSKVSTKIRSLISQIKSSRSSRDTITDDVKAQKRDRRKLNEQIRKKIEEIKKLNVKRREMQTLNQGRRGPPITPERIKREIVALDLRVETEALAFKDEKKIMAKIKDLKRQFVKIGGGESGDSSNYRELSQEIDELRKKADAIHAKIQEQAGSSQEQHESMLGISKEIDEFRKAEKIKTEAFVKLKADFNGVNEDLKRKLLLFRDVQKALGEQVIVEQKEQTRKVAKTLRQKAKEVEAKLARGEKLTTEDLILMQGG